jgi:hypothetical protein
MINYIKVVAGVIVSVSQSSEINSDASLISTPEYMPQNIGKLYDDGVITDAPVVINTKISKRAFLVRIDPEMAAIDLASIDNPSGTTAERMVQAELRKFMRYVENSSYIDLSSTLVSQGLMALVALTLLTTARLNAIINDPVTEGEL